MMEPLTDLPLAIWRLHLQHPVIAILAWGLVGIFGQMCYNLFVHPLRKFPGPVAARASSIWKLRKTLVGSLHQDVRMLHESYGPVVRISPNELSFVEAQAWKDICGHHGAYEMAKDDNFYRVLGKNIPDSIITADRAEHGIIRRQLSHGFSDRSMRDQEPIIGSYVDLLMRRLEEHSENGTKPVDMRSWFNFATFDIIGNLGFGSDFGCLENSHYHPWVDAIANNLKESAYFRVLIKAFPPNFVFFMSQAGLFKGRKQHMVYTKKKVEDRMNLGVERPDFLEGLLRKKDMLSQGELEMNAQLIIVAGSETTATLMSGALFLFATHPEVMRKLTEEVRSAFSDEKEIKLTSVSHLNYMLACLNEALRMYPPVPIGLPRVVPKGGHTIAGHWVPEGTTVAVWQFAAYLNSQNFTNPDQFQPSRFLGDEKFASDNLDVLQPFSVGPRNCIGRNLAYAEMRLIIARLLYKFDVELAPEAKNWLDRQKVYTLWDKPELPVYLKPVRR